MLCTCLCPEKEDWTYCSDKLFFFFLMWLSVFYCLNMMGGDFTVRPVEQERKNVQ